MLVQRSQFQILATLVCCVVILIGCSGGNSPIEPDLMDTATPSLEGHSSGTHPGPAKVISTDGPRHLWGLYTITVTPDGEVSVQPTRDVAGHLNVTMFLLYPHCDYCLTLEKTGLDLDVAWISLNVGLANPMELTGCDVRGIILEDVDYYLMNADAKTVYVGKNIMDFPQGFKAYATDQPSNTFPAKVPGDPVYFYQEFKIHIPPPYQPVKLLEIQYAVDVSFPHNCEEPWYIGDLDMDAPMYENTPSVSFSIEVRDHQDDVESVTITAPPAWNGDAPILTQGTGDLWLGTFEDCLGNPPGTYSFDVVAISLDQATGMVELPLYKTVDLVVNEEDCTGDPKANPATAETLELVGEVWDSLCTDNAQDYYLIDFSESSMQQLGILNGTITLESCVPHSRLGLVYYDPVADQYYDGAWTTGTGTVAMPIHIPNSEFVGDEAEKCYLRVSGPVTGAVDTPYKLVTSLEYLTTGCGDPVSLSTVGAPDISLSNGMVQGYLCVESQIDWYRLDTTPPDNPFGRITGTLSAEIEEPETVPSGSKAALSFRDEDGTPLANFYMTLDEIADPLDLADLDLPSLYVYYLCVNRPESEDVDQFYRITWDITIDPTCAEDTITLDNPAPPHINPWGVPWFADNMPGSSARMWLCEPDDTLDAYPFDVPASWPSYGDAIGGTMRIQSFPSCYASILVAMGFEDTTTNSFCWGKSINLSSPDAVYNIGDYWQFPTDMDPLPLKYWIKAECADETIATMQLELSLGPALDCIGEGDSEMDPSGTVVPNGTAAGLLSSGSDPDDYWFLDWDNAVRVQGDVGVVCEEEVQLRLYYHGALLAEDSGMTPSVDVTPFDLGSDCVGPVVRISLIGSPGECIQYFITGDGLIEFIACSPDPDQNDTLGEIMDKPWMWFDAIDNVDEICGVVCRDDIVEDIDCFGLLGQPYGTQGVLYGMIGIDSLSADGHQVKLVSMDGEMVLSSNNLEPPFYMAMIELGTYNLPAIPPKGYRYHAHIEPDPTGGDSFNPYRALASLGINDDPLCIDDGHDLQSEAWVLEIPNARLGILCGTGDIEGIDIGLPDLADWFVLDYTQVVGEYLQGDIILECEVEDVTVRLMPEGEPAGSGIGLYTASIPNGGDSVTISIPDGDIPSVPTLGSNYYIVVHNNGVGGWAPYALKVNLVSQ